MLLGNTGGPYMHTIHTFCPLFGSNRFQQVAIVAAATLPCQASQSKKLQGDISKINELLHGDHGLCHPTRGVSYILCDASMSCIAVQCRVVFPFLPSSSFIGDLFIKRVGPLLCVSRGILSAPAFFPARCISQVEDLQLSCINEFDLHILAS